SPISPLSLHDALPISVVEHVLGVAVVHGDNWEHQRAVGSHRPQPDHACRGLFRATYHTLDQFAAILVNLADQVRAVVHCLIRLRSEEHTSELQSLAYL